MQGRQPDSATARPCRPSGLRESFCLAPGTRVSRPGLHSSAAARLLIERNDKSGSTWNALCPRAGRSDPLDLTDHEIPGPGHVGPPQVLDGQEERPVELRQEAEEERIVEHAQARRRAGPRPRARASRPWRGRSTIWSPSAGTWPRASASSERGSPCGRNCTGPSPAAGPVSSRPGRAARHGRSSR